jgi:hypothetical protein
MSILYYNPLFGQVPNSVCISSVPHSTYTSNTCTLRDVSTVTTVGDPYTLWFSTSYCHVYGVCAWLIRRVLDWMIGFLIHTILYYWQYSAIADLQNLQFTVTQALGFSVFTSRILATDLKSHCHFKSHMKYSFHSPIHSLPFLQLSIPKTRLNSIPSSYLGRMAPQNSILHSSN